MSAVVTINASPHPTWNVRGRQLHPDDCGQRRHDEVFPKEIQKAFTLGKRLVEEPWK